MTASKSDLRQYYLDELRKKNPADMSVEELLLVAKLTAQHMRELEGTIIQDKEKTKERMERMQSLKESELTAIVLVIASDLENLLEDLIRARMPNLNKKLGEKLFDTALGALHNLSSKIDIAYAFDLIGAGLYKDLHALRDIRNTIAHARQKIHLNNEEISRLFHKFNEYQKGKNRYVFLLSKATKMRRELVAKIKVTDPNYSDPTR